MREDSVEVIKKTLCVYFFFGKRSEENNNFWTQKLGNIEKQKKRIKSSHSLKCTLSLKLLSFLNPLRRRKKNNLSMKNKFNIKGSQFFIFLFPNPPSSRSFLYFKKPHEKKNFVIFYIHSQLLTLLSRHIAAVH